MSIGIGSTWLDGTTFIEENYIKVKAVRDQAGHWYIIPNELVEDFYKDNEDELDNFDDKYYKYRTGGDLNLIQLYKRK